MLTQAQNGQVIDNLAQQFGLSPDQVEDAVQTVLPVLTRSVQTNIQSKQGLESLLRALSSGHHARYYEDPSTIGDPAAAQDGEAILGHMLGSERQKRALATQASYATGIGGALLEQILPYIANILMGMIFKNGGPSIGREFGGGGGGYSRAPDIKGFPRMPDTGGSGGNWQGDYTPQDMNTEQYQPVPYDDIADEVSNRRRGPGGFTGGIRDAIGGMLGGKTSGIVGYIIKFIVLRFGWRILRGIIGMVLGGRR